MIAGPPGTEAAGGGADAGTGAGAGPSSVRLVQPDRLPRINAPATRRQETLIMWLILLEALGALLLLLGIVWWTMFSGRRRGERDRHD
jgi:hypothetical protein